MKNTVHTLELGDMANFIHIIADTATRQAMVVDPAWDAVAIEQCCQDNQLTLTGILLTHSHADHTSAIGDLLTHHDLPVYVSREEFRIGKVRLKQPTFIADGEVLALGNSEIHVIATPGHTIGSVCYRTEQHLVAGDTLFINGCGRCNFYESDVSAMWDSLQRLKQLPDDLTVYPGHDYGQSKTDILGQQKWTNPYLLIEDKDFFIEFRTNLQAQYRSIPFAPSSVEEMQAIQKQHGF